MDAKDSLTQVWAHMRRRGPSQIQFWFIALMIGIAAGLAAVLFRYGISILQTTLYGVEDVTKLHSFAANLPWYWVLMIPMVGGVAVGIILHHFTPDGRVRSVADVIEGAALNEGRVEKKGGRRLCAIVDDHTWHGGIDWARGACGAYRGDDFELGQQPYPRGWYNGARPFGLRRCGGGVSEF